MRDILFRGKKLDNGEWVEGNLSTRKYSGTDTVLDAHIILDAYEQLRVLNMYSALVSEVGYECFKVDPETVCLATEYTKENKRVFENDIIKYDDCLGIVKFGKYRNASHGLEAEHYGFYIDWKEDRICPLRKDIGFWMNERDAKVVGNVFDNADLLERKE